MDVFWGVVLGLLSAIIVIMFCIGLINPRRVIIFLIWAVEVALFIGWGVGGSQVPVPWWAVACVLGAVVWMFPAIWLSVFISLRSDSRAARRNAAYGWRKSWAAEWEETGRLAAEYDLRMPNNYYEEIARRLLFSSQIVNRYRCYRSRCARSPKVFDSDGRHRHTFKRRNRMRPPSARDLACLICGETWGWTILAHPAPWRCAKCLSLNSWPERRWPYPPPGSPTKYDTDCPGSFKAGARRA